MRKAGAATHTDNTPNPSHTRRRQLGRAAPQFRTCEGLKSQTQQRKGHRGAPSPPAWASPRGHRVLTVTSRGSAPPARPARPGPARLGSPHTLWPPSASSQPGRRLLTLPAASAPASPACSPAWLPRPPGSPQRCAPRHGGEPPRAGLGTPSRSLPAVGLPYTWP